MTILKRYLGRNAYCWPGQKPLAAELGVTRRRLQHWLGVLQDAGLIEIERTNRTNRYWIPPRPGALKTAHPDALFSSHPDAQESAHPDALKSSHPNVSPIERISSSSSISEGAAAAASSNSEERQLAATVNALIELGMPDQVRTIAEADESLAQAALLHFKFRLSHPRMEPIRNRTGYIVACLRNPEAAGFTKGDRGDWRPPAGEPPRQDSRGKEHPSVEQHLQNVRDFDALPEDKKAKIRSFVREKMPLFSSNTDDADGFRTMCVRCMLQWRREGKL